MNAHGLREINVDGGRAAPRAGRSDGDHSLGTLSLLQSDGSWGAAPRRRASVASQMSPGRRELTICPASAMRSIPGENDRFR